MRFSLLFRNISTKQTVAKNLFWLSFGQILGRFLKAFLVIYAARILGTAGYGRFSLALSIVALIFNFSSLGLNTLTTRELAKKRENKDKYLSTIFYIRTFLTSAAILASLIASFFIPSEKISKIIFVLIIMATFESLVSFFYGIARGVEKMEKEALTYLTEVLFAVIFGLIVLFKFPSAFNLAIAYALGAIFSFFAALKFFYPFAKIAIKNFSRQLVKGIINDAWPFALTTLIASILGYTDITMLGWLLKNSSDVGIYSAPLKIVNLLFIPVGLIAGSIFPLLSRRAQEKSELNVIRKMVSLTLLFSLPLVFGGFILSKPLTLLIFGPAYFRSAKIFSTLIFMVLAVYPTTIFGNLLFAHNLQKKAAIFSGITAAINIFLNYLFISKLGIIGAAIATVTSQFISFSLFFSYAKKLEKAWPITLKQIKNPLLASSVMALLLYLPPLKSLPVLITITLGGLIYLLALVILKEPAILEIKSLILKRRLNQ